MLEQEQAGTFHRAMTMTFVATSHDSLFLAVRGFQIREQIVLSVVLWLCLSIVLQMLGAPGTLLTPTLSSDLLGSTILEGFSIPPSPIPFMPPAQPLLIRHPLVVPHVPLLSSMPFHPPL